MFFFWATVALATCEPPNASEDFNGAMQAVEDALAAADGKELSTARGRLKTITECIKTPLGAEQIAHFYRIEGLFSYVSGRNNAAVDWFAAARRIEPEADLPIYPDGHQAQLLYRERDPSTVEIVKLPPPKRPMWLDGMQTRRFAVGLPTVIQTEEAGFQVLDAGAVPSYPQRRPVRVTLLAASAVGLACAVVNWGVSFSANKQFDKPGNREVLAARKSLANGSGTAGLACGGVAIGAATAAVFTRR